MQKIRRLSTAMVVRLRICRPPLLHAQKLLFEKLSGVRKLTTFYLAKTDHRLVTFIPLKTINAPPQPAGQEVDAHTERRKQQQRTFSTFRAPQCRVHRDHACYLEKPLARLQKKDAGVI